MFFFFFQRDPSTPSFYLQLFCTKFLFAECPSFFYYFNSGNTFRKKISKPKRSDRRCLTRLAGGIIRKLCITRACIMFLKLPELSGLAGHYSMEKIENLLAGNIIMQTCSYHYWYLPITEKTWTRLPMSIDWKDISYDSILIIVGLYDK